jgi:uncharacterized membrane protein HdeD (DUF308 family)
MIHTLIKNWWLLALVAVLNATFSVTYLIMLDPISFRKYAVQSTLVFLGRVALAAGVAAIVAGVWRSTTGKCWPLVFNGIAFVALGVIFTGAFGPRIGLRTVALLVISMALGIGILEFAIARTLGRHRRVVDGWLVGLGGAISLGFAVWFLALVFGLIRLGPGSHTDFIWFGSYFGFSAISMFGLAVRLHGLGPSGSWEVSQSLNPVDTRRQQAIDRDTPSDPFALMSES